MAKRKPGFTLEQHDQLGLELQTMYDRLGKIDVEISKHYRLSGKESKPLELTKKAQQAIWNLRDKMGNVARKEFIHSPEIDVKRLYDRAGRDDHVTNPRPIRPFPEE
ncbi:hypothetical protein [Desulfotignum phosphitoxidans]|uniref:Uncharacterized protein n=1 Tax=Desulfotignum phosphitoxidans DSM 13687 TaxID=1286635 RepID=S0G556_9BACT|nr:hypothetical protein [Desulfotignum phosphitoxidans]EMS79176.1 hypothetical protein Dpo_5c00990 [Desulfotignum phosphitoxidans DSM 13687]